VSICIAFNFTKFNSYIYNNTNSNISNDYGDANGNADWHTSTYTLSVILELWD